MLQKQQQQQQHDAMQQLLFRQQKVAAAVAQMQAGSQESTAQEQLHMLQEKLKQEEAALAADVASAAMSVVTQKHPGEPKSDIPESSGKFDDDTLGILWGMVMEEGGDMLDSNGNLLESSDALTSMLGDMSGSLGMFDEAAADDINNTPDTGMAAVAASAVSAFEQEIYEAAKMTLNKGKSSAQGTEIAAELAAAVEAAVEPQLNQQDVQSQPLVPPFQGITPVGTAKSPTSLPSVQQQLELLQRQRIELERQQQIQLKQQQLQQEEEAQKLQQQLRELQENQLKQQREAQRLQQKQLQQKQAEEQIRVERQSQELHQQLQKQLELQNQKWNAAGQGRMVRTGTQASMTSTSSVTMAQPPGSAFKSADLMDTDSEVSNEPLLEIVDFTPEHAMIKTGSNTKAGKIVLSCSAPLPTLSDGNDPVFTWHTLVAFVDVGSGMDGRSPDLQIKAVDLSVLKKLNPYTYRCTVPIDAKLPGERLLILVGVRLYSGTDPVCQGVGAGVAIALQAAWRTAFTISKKGSSSRPTFTRNQVASGPGANANIQLLSQLSEDSFLFQEGNNLSASSASLHSAAHIRPEMKENASMYSSVNGNNGFSVLNALSNTPERNVCVSSALDEGASVRRSRKRSATFSSSELGSPFSPGYNAMTTINPSTAQWVTIKQPQNETMTEDADRHCKIRFVEKSNSTTTGAGDAPLTSPSPGSHVDTRNGRNGDVSTKKVDGSVLDAGSCVNEAGSLLYYDDTQLKGMDNDQLDNVLDNLFVGVVENLVEISTSNHQLQEGLNSPDKSGFTLLHYASMYNLHSLIPMLISRGANPDAPTTRGMLTPLHLACGAGNESAVELLVRSGCVVWVYDSYDFSPMDHAVRNGFPKIAQWLKDAVGEDTTRASNQKVSIEKKESDSMELEIELNNSRSLAQNAFSNLSLKDKLALNLLLKKRRNNENGSAHDVSNDDVSETDKLAAYLDGAMSQSDTESLNVAMRLMNQEELDDLENKSRDVDGDLRKWMLRRNYESLKEATVYLQHTKNENSSSEQAGSRRGLFNVKNQAIAGLIIRKNVSRLYGGREELLTS
mmetsp:Transcript_35029/g.51345  ORF Transcript_35029/g.51345 Transcript_35029/m.51345 type:complete len:1067 (-) Transcript_35029:450-3650(-)